MTVLVLSLLASLVSMAFVIALGIRILKWIGPIFWVILGVLILLTLVFVGVGFW